MARSIDKWNALTPTYRARLESKGITEQVYLSGAPLSRARGHSLTPEHPSDAVKKPERYGAYLSKQVDREALYRRVREWMLAEWDTGNIERIDVSHLRQNIMDASPNQVYHMSLVRDFPEWQYMAARKKLKRNPYWYH